MSDNELLLAISNIVEKQVESVKQELTQKIDKIQEEVTKNRLILENDISRKIDVIREGHDFLKMHLNNALSLDLKREAIEIQIINLRMEVTLFDAWETVRNFVTRRAMEKQLA